MVETSPADSSPDGSLDLEWLRVEDRTAGFSLECPAEWERSTGRSGSLLTVRDSHADTTLRANLNVIRKVDDSLLNLDDFTKSNLDQLSRVLTDPMIIDVHALEIDEKPARRLVVAYRQGLFGLTSDQWLLRDTGYVWLISSATGTDMYDVHEPVFRRMASSLRVISQ